MISRSWGQPSLALLALCAVVFSACGSDDQPGALGGGTHDSGSGSDGTGGGDGASADGLADATSDGGALDATNDITSEVAMGSDADGGDLQDSAPKDGALFDVVDAGCGTKSSYSNNGDGGVGACGTGQTYSCQGDAYVIDCECPTGICRCQKNGATVGAPLLYGGCPSCSSPNYPLLAASCAIPY